MKGAKEPKYQHDTPNDSSFICEACLVDLKSALERIFFAEVSIQTFETTVQTQELIIALTCNFTLTESLFYLNNGNWGGFKNDDGASELQKEMFNLSAACNNRDIDIKELSIHLKDTSIIVSKLFPHSISDQLGNILSEICSNFVHFTKALTEMPYEIYLPIFEDETSYNEPTDNKVTKTKPDYLNYWELYFESDTDSRVYNVKEKTIISNTRICLLEK